MRDYLSCACVVVGFAAVAASVAMLICKIVKFLAGLAVCVTVAVM